MNSGIKDIIVFGATIILIGWMALVVIVLPRLVSLQIPSPEEQIFPPIPEPEVDIDTCERHYVTISANTRFASGLLSMQYGICEPDYIAAVEYRSTWPQKSYEDLQAHYEALLRHDFNSIEAYANAVKEVAFRNNLTKAEAAELAIRQIQQQQYFLVHVRSCQEIYEHAKNSTFRRLLGTLTFIEQYHLDADMSIAPGLRPNRPCVEEAIPYGVLSPVEFAYNLSGDCDTRTLFLYAVLRHLSVPVIILNSDIRHHSILGVAGIPSNGTSTYFHKATSQLYILCETTNPTPLGVIRDYVPSEWYVALGPNLST